MPGLRARRHASLSAHDWPGNVRELENLVERLVVVAGTRMVVMEDLPAHLRIQVIDFERDTRRLPASGVDLRIFLTQLEERLIAAGAGAHRRQQEPRRRALGLNRTTLVEKLRRRSTSLSPIDEELKLETHMSVGERRSLTLADRRARRDPGDRHWIDGVRIARPPIG